MNTFPPECRSIFRRTFCLVLSFVFVSLLVVGLLSSTTTLHAQSYRTALITQPVIESQRVTLSGNVHPLATRAADRGAAPASMPAGRMLLLLQRSSDQEQALRATIESLHDRNSPNFHKWLTPAQFGAQWGAADSDIAAVTAWLQSNGFEVKGPTAGRTAIEFSGTTGQIQQAFHTEIHLYQVNGQMHHANATNPQIPAALAPIIAGVSMLNDFHPQSMAQKGPRGIYNIGTRKARPEYTPTGGSSSNFLYVGPADAATVYDSPIKALNPAATGTTIDGTGTKIGIVGDSNISIAQDDKYRQLFGLTSNSPTVIVDGDTDPGVNGDALEAYLDTQVAGGIAPGAQVYLYTAADTNLDYGLNLAAVRAVNDNMVDVLSVSFAECEAQLAYPGNEFFNALWEQAAAQGISVTVSTGDSGSAGCDNPNYETLATYGLQVNGLASTPFNIAVGGTDFAALAGPDGSGSDFSDYVSLNNDSGTLRSALKYIPEAPWNDSDTSYPPGSISKAKPFSIYTYNIVAGGGGKSNCSQGYVNPDNSLNCVVGYPKPSWQSGTDQARDIPDVSLFAANGHYGATWGICTDLEIDGSGNVIPECVPGANGLPANEFYISGVGGTSASAPAFAGILALVRQSTGERQGQADYVLYNLAKTSPGVFHDLVTGNNSVPCQAGTANCSQNSVGSNFLSGYNAGTGYDMASGLGSVDISALITNWANASLSSTTTALTLSPGSIQHGELAIANATVTSGGGTPVGDIALSASVNPTSFPLGSSLGTYTLGSTGSTGNVSLNSLPGGSYKVVASYGGSHEFALSVSQPVEITVTPETSITAITMPAYNPMTQAQAPAGSVPYGYFINISANPYGSHSPVVGGVVQPDGIATGNVTFKDGGTFLQTSSLASNGFAVVNGYLFPSAGSHTVTASYSGDGSFHPSVGTQVINVSKGATQLSMTASTTKYAGKPVVFTVNLSTASAGAAPTGMVALESGTTILAQANLTGVGATVSTVAGGTATISFSNFTTEQEGVKAVYLGDANYAGSSSSTVNITGHSSSTTTKLILTPSAIQHGENVAADATVTSGGGTPTGVVTLSASVGSSVIMLGNATGAFSLSSAASTGLVSINDLPGGSYTVIASYGGTNEFSSSVSDPVTLTVSPESSTTAVAVSSQNPLNDEASQSTPYGYPLGFTAHPYGNRSRVAGGVVQPDGAATGNVVFKDGSTVLETDALAANGSAVAGAHFLTAGSHTVSASYSGDASFDPSVGAETVTISQGVTQITLATSASKYAGKPIVFTVNLSTVSAGVAPTGTVALESGTTILAKASLSGIAATNKALASGSATISLSSFTGNQDEIKAVYLGDANYAGSTSSIVDISSPPSFVLSSVDLELSSEHGTAAGDITTTSEGGYSGTINYTCELVTATTTTAPPECAMDPASETLTAGGTVTPEILIFGKGTKLPPGIEIGSNARWIGTGGAALACCLLFGIPARRRGWRAMLAVILLLTGMGGFTACARPGKLISSGQYTFKVTAVDSKNAALTGTATVTVKVQ